MTDFEPPRLSELIDPAPLEPRTDRRTFLSCASALTLAIPGVGAALVACSPGKSDTPAGDSAARAGTGSAAAGAANATYHRFDPTLPSAVAGGRVQLHWHAREVPVRISADTVVAAWTFEGDIPGPIVHCRVGDTVEFTLTNDADIPHSMDFHAAQIDPKVAFRSVAKGQSVTFTFRPKFAGAFMYHCGTAPVLMHIASGSRFT